MQGMCAGVSCLKPRTALSYASFCHMLCSVVRASLSYASFFRMRLSVVSVSRGFLRSFASVVCFFSSRLLLLASFRMLLLAYSRSHLTRKDAWLAYFLFAPHAGASSADVSWPHN
jgi:hypothetical protein